MKSYGVRKTLAILLSVVLALPLFVFATFADDPVFTQLPVYSDSVESGQTWYNRSQLKSDTANENYDSATIYLSEDGNTLKIVYTANAETVTELHTRAQEPAYFAYLCVLPEFGDPLPTSPDGLSDGDYWFDKDGLVELVRSYGMQEDYMYFYTDATYRLSVDGTILRKSVTLAGTTYTTHDDEFLANPTIMSRFLHQVGVDPNAGFTLLPTSDEGLEDGDYWFDVETLAAALSEESAQLYRSAQFYLSEDGSTLRMVTAALTQDFDKEEYGFFFTYLHQVGVDPNAGFVLLPTSDAGLEAGDYWFDVESLAVMVGEENAQNYRSAQYYLSDDALTMRVIMSGYSQDYTSNDENGGVFYFSFLRQVGVDPNAGFILLPYSSEGLEDGDYWFDLPALAESDSWNEEQIEQFKATTSFYLSEDGSKMRMVQGGYTTEYDLNDPADSGITTYLRCVGVDPNAGFTVLPVSGDGLRYGEYWYDAAGLAASDENEELARASYYLSDDGSTIRIVSESITINVSRDNEELGELVFGFLHQVGEDETKAYLTVNVPDEPVCNGDTVQVTVDLEQNPGLVGMLLSLNYDPAVLTLTNVQGAGMMTAGNLTPGNDLSARPYNILWDDGTVHANHTETGTILTLTFTVKDTAAAGSTAITLTYAADSTFNVDLQDVALHISDAALAIVRHTPGDADGDGEVSVMDITVLSRYLAEGWDVTVDARNSDVNGDGELDLRDVVLIRRFLAGGWGVELV